MTRPSKLALGLSATFALFGLTLTYVASASTHDERDAHDSHDTRDARDAGKAATPRPDAVSLLSEGNAAFVAGKSKHPRQTADRLAATANGQKPFVTILSCSDSRAPVELLFDQGIGDIFTVRVAGNVADTDELGTIEYGVDHLGTPTLVVLGHTKCGAVTAVCNGAEVHGHVPELVDNIAPAVEAVKAKRPQLAGADLVSEAIKANVFQSISDVIVKSPVVRTRLKDGKVTIVGAVYHIENGQVDWLGPHPEERELIAKGDAAPSDEHAAKDKSKDGRAEHKAAHGHDEHASTASDAGAHHGELSDAGSAHGPAGGGGGGGMPPLGFAIMAFVGTLAGAISMRLVSK